MASAFQKPKLFFRFAAGTFSTLFALSILGVPSARVASGSNPLLISVNRIGDSGNGASYNPAVSDNGRFVAFTSEATDLVDISDTNKGADVFVRNLLAGTTTLVSVNLQGTATGNQGSTNPAISADGRFVAFFSDATDLVATPTGNPLAANVFVRDMAIGKTTLVSVNKDGTASGNHNSLSPMISPDGRFVAFVSVASDLVAQPGPPLTTNVFLRDLQAGTTKLVSINSAGTGAGNRDSGQYSGGGVLRTPVITPDGRFVAFSSFATNLVNTADNNDGNDIFVRDVLAGTTTLVSVNSAGTGTANDASDDPAMSADGRFVAFKSRANDITPNDRFIQSDVFVRDLQAQTTTLVSVNTTGVSSQGDSYTPSISSDGRYVAFASYSNDLVATAKKNHSTDVFVRDLQSGTTSLVSVNASGTGTGNDGSYYPVLSADGMSIAFQSDAGDLVLPGFATNPNTASAHNIFIRDFQTGATLLASVSRDGNKGGNNSSIFPLLAANGSVVTFISDASDLVPNDSNRAEDVFALIRTTLPLAPFIASLKYRPTGKLIVAGEGFDPSAKVFVDSQQVAPRSSDTTTLVLKKLTLGPGTHSIQVVNSDGQIAWAALHL